MTITKCPKCAQEFRVQSNLKYRYPRLGFKFSEFKTDLKTALKKINPYPAYEMIHNQDLVVCPGCCNEYNAPEQRNVARIKKVSIYFIVILMFSLVIFGHLIFISIVIFDLHF